MRPRNKTALVAAALVLASGWAEACGSDHGAPSGDAGADGPHDTGAPDTTIFQDDASDDSQMSSCAPNLPPKSATDTVTISLKNPQFGDFDPDGGVDQNAWEYIGYNIDGLCTSSTDTNVCSPADGGSRVVQQDGINGTDNAFGHVVIPIIEQTLTGFLATSQVVIDLNGGVGSVYITNSNGHALVVPITAGFVAFSKTGGGTLAGIVPTAAFEQQFRAFDGRISGAFCGGAGSAALLAEIDDSSDILADGSQSPSSTCNAITIGIAFAGSSSTSEPAPLNDPCARDAGSDASADASDDGGAD